MASTPSLRSEESGGLETGYSLLPPSETADVLNLTLHQCARDGDEVNMKILFRHLGVHLRKKINEYDDDSLTPLHYAARYNFLGVVKLLVENGADVNKVGEDDDTPLHHAARYRQDRRRTDARGQNRMASPVSLADLSPSVPGLNGIPFQEEGDREFFQGNSSVICYLISKGANINCRDTYGQTPLHFAAMRGNVCACKDLLRFGDVNIEAKDKQGICPLHMAAIHNQVEVARLLIEAGADLRSTDNEQSRPLHHACGSGSTEIVQLLFGAASRFPEMISDMVTDTDIKLSTCLHVAVDNGHYEVAQLCIEKEAEVNRPRKQNMYPLHLAAMSGDMRIVRLLVDHSARIDAVNDDRATALHNAAAFNHTEVINFLLEKGADINRHDKDNYTPLLLAATYGHADTVELLLRKGADYSAVDKHEKTAIFLAAEENKLQALRKLLEHPQMRQIINFSDQHGNSPLHIASQQGHLDVVKYLLANNADIDAKNEEEQTPLHLAAKFGRTNVVREIIRHDKSVINNEDEKSNTALHLAAQYGHNKMAALLIELGAHVSARNYNQWTPLDLAAAKGWTKTCHVLLSNDAPIDPVDKNKTTPLHLAARHGHPRVVQLLLDRNANVTLEDSRGCNCLDLAIENMHVDVAMTIINSNVWIKALRNSTKLPGTDNIETPLRKLIKKMPAVAEKVFDRCLIYGQEKNPEHPEYEVTFNYEFLDDACAPWIDEEYRSHLHSGPSTSDAVLSSGIAYDDNGHLLPTAQPYTLDRNYLKKNHPLYIMVTSKRVELLGHPLVTSLLRHKWNSFGRFFYYLSLCVYIIFLSFLTGYITVIKFPQEKLKNECLTNPQSIHSNVFATVAMIVVLLLSVISLLKEMLQFYQAKLAYLGWTNLIEWIIYITAILLVVDLGPCQEITGYKDPWQWSFGAVCIFLSWLNLLLFIQKFPQFGIYVVMFTDVLYTFLQFFVVFLLFIIAFALAFYTVLQNQISETKDIIYGMHQLNKAPIFHLDMTFKKITLNIFLSALVVFQTVPDSLIKTTVMMIGEIDFKDIFHSDEDVLYPAITYIIFVIFLVVMSILIMNLLVGLAVDDIKAVQEQASLKRLAMQVELTLDVEKVIPDFIWRKAFLQSKTIKPNTIKKYPFRWFSSSGLTAKNLQDALHPELDTTEKVLLEQEKLGADVKKLKRTVTDLQESSQRLESMLRAIIRENRIVWEDEDYQEEDEVEKIDSGLGS